MTNPYEAPAVGWDAAPPPTATESLGELRHTLVLTKFQRAGASDAWKLELYDQHARIVDAEGETFAVFAKSDLPTKIDLVLLGGATILSVNQPSRMPLGISTPDVVTLKTWLGPELQAWLSHTLRRRRRASAITGLVFVIFGLVESSPLLIGYGMLVGVLWVLSRVHPHRVLFIGEAALSLLFVGFLALAIGVWGTLEWWWSFVGVIAFLGIGFSVRAYKFFGPA
jgi:hypothetical protein